jgi:hypothetical protein
VDTIWHADILAFLQLGFINSRTMAPEKDLMRLNTLRLLESIGLTIVVYLNRLVIGHLLNIKGCTISQTSHVNQQALVVMMAHG